jgi:hypothetical protein
MLEAELDKQVPNELGELAVKTPDFFPASLH